MAFGPAATALRRSLLSSTAAHRNRDTSDVLEALPMAFVPAPRFPVYFSAAHRDHEPGGVPAESKTHTEHDRLGALLGLGIVYIAPDVICIWNFLLGYGTKSISFLSWRPTCNVGSYALIDQYELRPAQTQRSLRRRLFTLNS